MNLQLLVNLEKISILAKLEDIKKGTEKYYISYQGRIYETIRNFKCISEGHTDKTLYSYLRPDWFDNKELAQEKFQELHNLLAPKNTGPSFGDQLQEMMLKVLAEQSVDKVLETTKPILDEFIKETYGPLPQKIQIHNKENTKEIKGVTHEKFGDVLQLVNLDIPVYLEGPAGTGKNIICKQIAESLDLEFYFSNAVTQEFKLTGFIDANGYYHETQFYQAFKNGGVFFLDEMDASIPEVLIILNAAIANRYFDFPTGKIEAHPDFKIIAAGNTVGNGATLEYNGRYQIDGASLDRFAIIHIGYSPKIEDAISNGNSELVDFIREFRKVTENEGIYCIASYRTIERITKLEGVMDLSTILKISLVKALNEDDIKMLANKMDDNNKYVKALYAA